MVRSTVLLTFLPLLLLGLSPSVSGQSNRLPVASPADSGFRPEVLGEIDAAVADAIAEKKLPGCVVCIGRQGKIALLKTYGNRRLLPAPEPMTANTVFDLASLTKPIATGTSVLILTEEKKLDLDQPVVTYLPEFSPSGKDKIIVRQLLIHTSGLIPDNSLADYGDDPEASWKRVCELKPRTTPGERFDYSDMGFIVLGKLVERLSGMSLREFTQAKIYEPLGMSETGYLPREELKARAAPTEQRNGQWMQGEVHDPRAYKLGGIAGHAGLFSTAEDLAIYASAMLGHGASGQQRIMQEETWKRFTQPHAVPGRRSDGTAYEGMRALGWDVKTGYSINRGEGMSAAAFGHGGFTGTGIWIDPENDLFVIFLSNRVHPDGKGLVNPLIGKIGSIVVQASERR